MGQPFIGEIRMFAGNFNPVGWEFCDGQQVPISENDTLFVLIGTTYGGDGQEVFNLPNMQSRVPMHSGNGFTIGEMAGVESVTLTTSQIPSHNHAALASASNGSQASPVGALLAQPATTNQVIDPKTYSTDPPIAVFPPSTITPVGGSQPHDNMQPYLVINFIISMFGIFPQSN
ncbi:MAG TPA: tail fiber protein [Allosphingosinicella sp.]